MRGFSDDERAQIRAELIEAGRDQILKYGPERTRVKDVTEPVGIAKPTFYQFFDSKGELYLEILAREIDRFAEQLRAELGGIEDARAALKRVFTGYVEFIETNPDLQRVMSENHPRELFRNVPQEKIDAVKQQWFDTNLPIIEDLQGKSDGALAERDPVEILNLLRPVAVMQMYKEKGTTRSQAHFEELQEMHIETLVRGLVSEDRGEG